MEWEDVLLVGGGGEETACTELMCAKSGLIAVHMGAAVPLDHCGAALRGRVQTRSDPPIWLSRVAASL